MLKSTSLILAAFILLLLCQCSVTPRDQSEVEKALSERFHADEASVTNTQVHTTHDNQATETEQYIEVILVNSKDVERVKHNDRVYENLRKNIVRYLIDSIQINIDSNTHELKLKLAERQKFLFYENQNIQEFIYPAW